MDESYKDTLYTIDKDGRRKWLYPSLVRGDFYWKRFVVSYLLMAVYLILPWIKYEERQAVFLDVMHRRFLFFGVELWATDTFFLFLAQRLEGLIFEN